MQGSHDSKPDRRKARTKQLLYEALMSLIPEKGAENITVTDIAGRANINRGTFYLHYRDVPDMLQQLKDEVFESIQSKMKMLDIKKAAAYAEQDLPYPHTVAVFDELARHADFLRTMFGPQGDLSYTIQLRELLIRSVYEKTQLVPVEKTIMPPDYFAAYVTSANFGFIMHWIQSGMNLPSEEMARIMLRIMHYGPLVSFGLKEIPPDGTNLRVRKE